MAANYTNNPNSITAGYGIGHAGTGGGGGVGALYGSTNASIANNGGITISGDLKLLSDDADVVISTKSLKKWMESVEKRLCILEPKKELIEEFEALREAYNHYKTLEALLYNEKK